MNNLLNSIDKAKASKIAANSGLVGLAAGLSYFLAHLDPVVFGTLAAPLAVAITLSLGALKKYALPNDADVVTPSVGSLEARGDVHVEKLEEQTCEDHKFLKSYLEGK